MNDIGKFIVFKSKLENFDECYSTIEICYINFDICEGCKLLSFLNEHFVGNEIYKGMQVLQDIYDRRRIANIAIASDWIAEKVAVRESHHAPYRYVMALSRVKCLEEAEKEKERMCDDVGDIFMELLLSGAFF